MVITGTLKNWTYDTLLNVYWGEIHNDIHKRWPDGTKIHTSHVVKKDFTSDGYDDTAVGLVHTLNSVYRMERLD